MKTDIIDTNYIFNHRIAKVWRTLALIYGIILIYLTMNKGFEKLMEYDFLVSIMSKIFIFSGVIFLFANMFIFLRVGKIFINQNKLTIEQKESKKIIDLNSINEITFGKEYGKFYYLKVLESDLVIELDKSQITELKKNLTKLNIKIKHRHFTDRVSEWFNKKNTLYNNV